MPLTTLQKTIQWQSFDFEWADTAKHSTLQYASGGVFEEYGSNDLFITDSRGYHGILMKIVEEYNPNIKLNEAIDKVVYQSVFGV